MVPLGGQPKQEQMTTEYTFFHQVGDIEAATAAKTRLEQRQREEAAKRKETKAEWETKLFRPIGENWFFKEPLKTRTRI